MHPILNIAIRAARMAGDLIAKHYETHHSVETSQKSDNDFVANIRREGERLIVAVIRKCYPQHGIIGKEGCELACEDADIQWMIDSLNGTTNFVKRFPHFSVSIAVRIKDRTEIAVIYDPMRNELFTASRGQGAKLNSYRLRGGTSRDLHGAILVTSFPFKLKQNANSYVVLMSKLFTQCADLRCTGSAALDFAYVAAGRVDGFFKIGLKPRDFAGGELLVCEAGGLVTDFSGGHNYLPSGNIVAGNPRIVKAMLLTIRRELLGALKR
ncbi:MAG: inositol-1-monophosphatase [Sodalis sp. (in: enterobacteria)]